MIPPFHWHTDTLPQIQINTQPWKSHKSTCRRVRERERAWQPLLWPHSSVACSDADVLSPSLTSTNGRCPRAAVQPTCRSASPDCGAGTRKPTGTETTHPHTLGHMYVHTEYTHTQGSRDLTVFPKHLCCTLRCLYYTLSPCSRPEINR